MLLLDRIFFIAHGRRPVSCATSFPQPAIEFSHSVLIDRQRLVPDCAPCPWIFRTGCWRLAAGAFFLCVPWVCVLCVPVCVRVCGRIISYFQTPDFCLHLPSSAGEQCCTSSAPQLARGIDRPAKQTVRSSDAAAWSWYVAFRQLESAFLLSAVCRSFRVCVL